MIQHKSICPTPLQLQCMLLWMQKDKYVIKYRPWKVIVLTSHLPSCSENLPIILHHNIQYIHFSSNKLNWIQWAAERDPLHSTLYQLTLNGWPDHIDQVLRITWNYWVTQDELSTEDGILTTGDSICIPPEMFDHMLADLHEDHQGDKKMQLLTWASVYWLSIDADITYYIWRCTTCTQYKVTQPIHLMLPWDIPDSLW